MHTTSHAAPPPTDGRPINDHDLLQGVVTAVRAAGSQLLNRYPPDVLPSSVEGVLAAMDANDVASLRVLRPMLQAVRPHADFVDDEEDSGGLPPGEWWVVDPVEGNVNHVHGLPDWAVTATLVRDDEPVLTAVHLPLTGQTYTAVRGAGAHLNKRRLQASAKTDLRAALVGTAQARHGEGEETNRRLGASVTATLNTALVVRVSVPSTLQLIQLAAGRMDVFWQHSNVRVGLLGGALLVTDAGGAVTDTRGEPWTLSSPTFLAAAPALHAAAVAVLAAT
jgi:myo-inositol-1(or 4)-monophosphatase